VILPEALAAFQAEEPSVLSIIKDLDGLVSWVGTPLDEIIEVLEQLVVNATSLGGAAFTLSVSMSFCTDITYVFLLINLNKHRCWPSSDIICGHPLVSPAALHSLKSDINFGSIELKILTFVTLRWKCLLQFWFLFAFLFSI